MKIGDVVRIKSQRPHKEQYNGCEGEIATITEKDLIYVVIGRYQPNFYPHELEVIEPPVGGAK